MVKVSSVWVRRAEGRIHECTEGFYPGFKEANAALRMMAHTAPDGGGYHKVDFVVTYEDGETYEGRVDLTRYGNKDIAKHMVEYLTFSAGIRCPAHMTEERYRGYLKGMAEHFGDRSEAMVNLLTNYELCSNGASL